MNFQRSSLGDIGKYNGRSSERPAYWGRVSRTGQRKTKNKKNRYMELLWWRVNFVWFVVFALGPPSKNHWKIYKLLTLKWKWLRWFGNFGSSSSSSHRVVRHLQFHLQSVSSLAPTPTLSSHWKERNGKKKLPILVNSNLK